MENHKLGIIVPYRNRPKQLDEFLTHLKSYLGGTDINYEIIVVNQDNAKQFNRGMLLNIGFIEAKNLKCDYVVFHDVDMLPIYVDYSYSNIPLHLATDFENSEDINKRELFDQYFGGVTMFTVESFIKIDGYSNKYWAWGYEDTDLLLRCERKGIELDTLRFKNYSKKGISLKFNGVDSYVECDNTIDLNQNATFFISFCPDNLFLNHEKESDEFTVFSIPGWDFAICYNSFSRYNFCAFDSLKNALYVNSKIKPNYKTNMVVVLDRTNNKIKVYQDGIYIGETPTFKKFYPYKKEKKYFLGVGNPNRETIPNFFKGTIDSFAYYDTILLKSEIKEISNNEIELLTNNFGDYKSSSSLVTYYDTNFIKNYTLVDLKGNNNGKIIKCEIVDDIFDEYKEIKIPHRRKSFLKSLPHEQNGFLGNKWKDQATRWNQLRFHNEVSLNEELSNNDGLSTLTFHVHGKHTDNKITQINVGL
jgi:uncharacterized protein YifN (PemK superfamily)